MAHLLWCRDLKLTIGSNLTGQGLAIGTGECNYRVDFSIYKNNTSKKNRSTITIYNLSPSIRESLDKEFDRVTLEVGYLGDASSGGGFLTVITDTWIEKVTHTRSGRGQDILTVLECGEGGADHRFSRATVTFDNGTSYRDVVSHLVNDHFGFVKLGDISAINPDRVVGSKNKHRTRNFTGAVKDILDEIAEDTETEWTIDDNIIEFSSNDSAIEDGIRVPLVSYETGMIGSVKKTEKGVNFETLIIPNLRVNRMVKVVHDTVAIGRDNRASIPSNQNAKTNLEKAIEEAKKNPEKQKNKDLLKAKSGDNDIYKILKIHYIGSNYTNVFKASVTTQRTNGYTVERPQLDRISTVGVIRGDVVK